MKRRVPCVIHGPGTSTVIGSVVLDVPPRTNSVRAFIIDAATHRGWPAVRAFDLDTLGPVTVMPVASMAEPRAYFRTFRAERPITFATARGARAAAEMVRKRAITAA